MPDQHLIGQPGSDAAGEQGRGEQRRVPQGEPEKCVKGMAARETASSSRCLYERLTDKRFQELCGAVLAHLFPDVTCYPVGQADGGRDTVLKSPTIGDVIYQVKWTSKPLRDPVRWLDEAIAKEADNIKELVEQGASKFYLLTSVARTSARKRGTMDKLDERLAADSETFGIPMQCWWRADIDARVDNASPCLKWTTRRCSLASTPSGTSSRPTMSTPRIRSYGRCSSSC
jgi:hypothetical protein